MYSQNMPKVRATKSNSVRSVPLQPVSTKVHSSFSAKRVAAPNVKLALKPRQR
jgi:hypothetical protein